MQKCGQLHASMAVALIAQSADGAVWPADTPSRAITDRKAILRMGVPLLSGRNYLPERVLSQEKSDSTKVRAGARNSGLPPLGDPVAKAISIRAQRLHRLNRSCTQCGQQCSY